MNPVFEANGLFAEPFQKIFLPLRDSSRSHIVLAVADEETVRWEVTAELGERLTGAYTFFEFDHADPPEPSLPRFCRSLAREAPILVVAHGLEVLARRDAEAYDTALHFLNAHREDITLSPCALVLWLTTRTLADVMERAPDFADWQNAWATFALPQGERLERTALGRLPITEAEGLRLQVRRYAEMLRRSHLDPALAAEFEKQRRIAETKLGRVADVRRDYLLHLVDALRDHLIRGFAPQVGGRVISLPLAKIFLPLEAVEGPPVLAEYA
ncbi:MAG: hypothetical protein GY844_10195, partial [Bradyrhizobium sp.]|nr:hypothetical protein [Bradyrhizobium sp.]